MFPTTGQYPRHLYKKHLEFFKATKDKKTTVFIAANRIGKSESAAYAVACWATGIYPAWWEGRRFPEPVNVWACCVTNKLIGEVLNEKLLGMPGEHGTGMIPKNLLLDVKSMPGMPETYQSCKVKHISGGTSYITFKSYEQRREAFQGTARDVIWLDEEPPADIYSECLTRTMTTKGSVIMTFTPLKGISDVVLSFMPGGQLPSEYGQDHAVINAGWDDAPHLTEDEKRILAARYSPMERDARMKGLPSLGAGAIYPIPEEDILCDTFDIPDYWPRFFAGDCGWSCTAGVFIAIDPLTRTKYLYDEYKRGQVEPAVHIAALRVKGMDWMSGVMDSAAIAESDGTRYIQLYRDGGLNIQLPNKARGSVDAGLHRVFDELSTSKLKVMKHCVRWLEEFRLYRRDEHGKIVKKNDHLMDSTRYGITDGYILAKSKEMHDADKDYYQQQDAGGRDKYTGY